ncbi:orotate phosphoribosyltransferase [Halothermothrix orenii]|uniref:orotate phosphoribosyltransferase n=1 Tax=Halothermothrix orenii TaxID=31909 RepID=UPI0005A2A354|nr:orotate phosphoribosyltransferase [Halothermothrix orenii]
MKQDRIIEIFKKTGVLREGHFLLSSGRHAEKYLQCARVLQYPEYANELAEGIAQFWEDDNLDVVIGPAIGGIVVSYAVGQALGIRAIFAERENGQMALRRNFKIEVGERILVVEDVVTTGGSVKEVLQLLEKTGGTIVGVSSLVDRSAGKVDFKYPYRPLIKLDIKSYLPEECPLCQQGYEVEKPGSRNIQS